MTRQRLTPFVVCLALLAAAGVTGCNTSSEVFNQEGYAVSPKPVTTTVASPDVVIPDSDPVRWAVSRVVVRLDHPIEEAWAITDETILPELTRAVWNGNGLRVGLVPLSKVGSIVSVFGDTVDQRHTRVLNYDYPDVLRRSPPLAATFFADLTLPPGPVNKYRFTRGRLCMLMASRPRGNGAADLTLTPQHYKPRASLLPRSPLKKLLDGRVFDELAVQLTVGPTEAILVGFYDPNPPQPKAPVEQDPTGKPSTAPPTSPTPPTPRPRPAKASQNPPSQAANNPAAEAEPPHQDDPLQDDPPQDPSLEEKKPPPLNLGRGIFTTGITGKDFQVLYLMRPVPH